ncbi:MAG: ABC-type sugar transport system, periplasmic component, partial [Thermomicrobiales bacterium]|nr:ABC-type sugar transport system, periplasmic component [Thermomicrobiales bacterium]
MSLSRRQLLQAASGASLGVVAGGPLRQSRASAQSGEKEAVTIQFWTHDQNYIDFFTARAAELTESADSAYAYELNITQAPTTDLVTKALAAYAAGSGVPDAIGIEISQFSRFMQRGVAEQTLLDLTDRVA